MAKVSKNTSIPNFNKEWTLFLDRDGTINKRIVGDYVRKPQQFEFLPGVLQALEGLARLFPRIVVVTNQQGIGKKFMTEEDLKRVHQFMMSRVELAGGRIDAIYHCPDLADSESICRKPKPGMAYQARQDMEEINFEQSVMIGDGPSDIEFGQRLGMFTVHIQDHSHPEIDSKLVNLEVSGLLAFWNHCKPILTQSK